MSDDYMTGFMIASAFSSVFAVASAAGFHAYRNDDRFVPPLVAGFMFAMLSFTWAIIAAFTLLGIGRHT